MAGRILLVDDNADFLDSICDLLELEGFEVTTAASGEDALACMTGRVFDLVLMDIKMPGMNGVECFMEMKKLQPGIRVMLATAYSVEELIQQARREGALEVLQKPLVIEELLAAVRRLCGGGGGRVLIVEDDRDLSDSLSDVLAGEGLQVSVAYDGPAAIESVQQQRFDVMVLDLKLPLLGGLEVFRRARTLHPGLTVIIISGYAREMCGAIDQMLSESARTFLEKPVDPAGLVALIRNVCAESGAGEI
jgi:two-component system, NtrC family, response regulator HydG